MFRVVGPTLIFLWSRLGYRIIDVGEMRTQVGSEVLLLASVRDSFLL